MVAEKELPSMSSQTGLAANTEGYLPAQKRSGGIAKLFLGLLVSAAFIWLIVREADVVLILGHLQAAKWPWLLVALIAIVTSFGCRARRWVYLLETANADFNRKSAMCRFITSYGLNNVLPLRAGDVYRVVSTQRLGFNPWSLVGLLVAERIIDLLTLLLLAALALSLSTAAWPVMASFGVTALCLIVAVSLMVLLCPGLFQSLISKTFITAITQRIPFLEGMRLRVVDVLVAIKALRNAKTLGRVVVLSFLGWACEVIVFIAAVSALSEVASILISTLAMSTATLSTVVPGAPGYFGTYHYFAMQPFVAGGVQIESAAAIAVLAHLFIWLPVIAFSVGYLLWPSRNISAKERNLSASE